MDSSLALITPKNVRVTKQGILEINYRRYFNLFFIGPSFKIPDIFLFEPWETKFILCQTNFTITLT